MPAKQEDLPGTIERSPKKVQDTYAKTLDSAHETYDSEERAHRTAFSAVKHVAEKKGDHWELKDEKGPSDRQAAKRGKAARNASSDTYGGIDASKPKSELYKDAKRHRELEQSNIVDANGRMDPFVVGITPGGPASGGHVKVYPKQPAYIPR